MKLVTNLKWGPQCSGPTMQCNVEPASNMRDVLCPPAPAPGTAVQFTQTATHNLFLLPVARQQQQASTAREQPHAVKPAALPAQGSKAGWWAGPSRGVHALTRTAQRHHLPAPRLILAKAMAPPHHTGPPGKNDHQNNPAPQLGKRVQQPTQAGP